MRRLLLFFLILALGVLIYLNLRERSRPPLAFRSPRTAHSQTAAPDIARAGQKDSSEAVAPRALVARLQKQLADKKEDLSDAQNELRITNNKGNPQNPIPDFQDRLRQQTNDATQIQAQLQSVRAQLAQASAQNKSSQDDQKFRQGQALQSYAQQILDQQQTIAQLNAQVSAASSISADYEARSQLPALKSRLQNAKTRLQGLINQRNALKEQYGATVLMNQAQSDQQMQDLKQTESLLSAQYQESQRAIRQTQGQIQAERVVQKSGSSEIEQMKSRIENLKSQVADLEKKLGMLKALTK